MALVLVSSTPSATHPSRVRSVRTRFLFRRLWFCSPSACPFERLNTPQTAAASFLLTNALGLPS
eukprot:7555863-Ditylum_brightwellii.AAC.1